MKHRRIILFLAVVLVVLGLWWLLRTPQAETTSPPQATAESATAPAEVTAQASHVPPTQAERLKEASVLVDKIFSSPIEFYGRVVDQNGDPVSHADVGYTAADKFNASGSNYTGQSDAQGYFQITGIKGAALGVAVRKAGYYFINERIDRSSPSSTATFGYSMGPDSYRRVPPTKGNPAVFVLHKMGKTEPLIPISSRTYRILRDGTSVEINLANGRVVPAGNGDLRVEAWTDDQASGKMRGYQWRCRVTVPGGGLVERKGQFDFEAPEDGYEESVELGMPENAEQWTSQQQGDYFLKLPDGRHARINFRMIAGGDHFFRLESFLNPTSGSRNLEYDPKQAVKAP